MANWVQKIALLQPIPWIWVFNVLAFSVVVSGCTPEPNALPYYNTPDFTPFFLTHDEAERNITHTIDGFEFTNQDGRKIGISAVTGKIHVANFMFTSCGNICPKMTNNMSLVSDAYPQGSGVVLLSYSVTPWIDNQERLHTYKSNKGIENNDWHFLTGKKADIYTLARQSYFAEEDIGFTKDSTDFLHTEHFILVDPNLKIRGIYSGTLKTEMNALIKDIGLLQKEFGTPS